MARMHQPSYGSVSQSSSVPSDSSGSTGSSVAAATASGPVTAKARRRLPFRRTRWAIGAVVVALVVYLGATFAHVLWASTWDEATEAKTSAEAAVVLGAAQYDGTPSAVFRARLDHAAELYFDEVVPRIVVTGGRAEGDRFTEAYSGLRYLIAAGVPEDDLIVVDDGRSTWESLAASGRVLRGEGIDTVVLVSDPYHSLRLKGIAHEVGLTAFVSPVDMSSPTRQVIRETGAVAIGRVIGYRRSVNWIG